MKTSTEAIVASVIPLAILPFKPWLTRNQKSLAINIFGSHVLHTYLHVEIVKPAFEET